MSSTDVKAAMEIDHSPRKVVLYPTFVSMQSLILAADRPAIYATLVNSNAMDRNLAVLTV